MTAPATPPTGRTPDGARPWWVPSVRGTAVLTVGCWCVLLGASYLNTTIAPAAVAAYGGALPVWLAGWVWIAVGASCLLSLVYRRWVGAMSLAALAHIAWAVASLLGWGLDGAVRGWVVAAAYITYAVLINAVTRMTDPPARRHRRKP